jgi:hypothetical protein
MPKIEKSHPCVLSPDGFKQALQKYAVRHAKGDADFALLSVHVSNYRELANKEGGETANLVSESLLRTCLSGLRQQDRVCCPADDFLLFLLPDADRGGAEQARIRVKQILSQAKLKQSGKILKPEGAVQSSHCGDAACDIDAMLHEVGAMVDEHGAIVKQEGEARESLLARAKLESWAQRYHGFTLSNNGGTGSTASNGSTPSNLTLAAGQTCCATDSWSDLPVRIHKVAADAAPAWDEVIRRARVLQSIDHPALNRLVDFHCDQQLHAVFLVWGEREGRHRLSEILGGKQDLKPALALRWIGEIVGALAYLQQLVPPVVPTKLSADDLLESGQDIVIDGGLDSYIFDGGKGKTVAALFADIAHLIERIAQSTDSAKLPPRLSELVAQLKLKEVPQNTNTMHKVRAAVRELVERAEKQQQIQDDA